MRLSLFFPPSPAKEHRQPSRAQYGARHVALSNKSRVGIRPGYLGQHLYKSNQSQRRFILPRWIVFDRASLLRSFFFCARSTLFSFFLPLGGSGLVCYADANSEEQRLIAPSRQRTNTNEQEKKASSFIRFGRHDTRGACKIERENPFQG